MRTPQPPSPLLPATRPGLWAVRVAALVMLASAVWAVAWSAQDYQVLKGFTPDSWVIQSLEPEGFRGNWGNGTEVYAFSAPMLALREITRLTGLLPRDVMVPYMVLMGLLVVGAFWRVGRVFFRSAWCALAVVAVALTCRSAGINLSRFGAGYGWYINWLNYGWALAMALIGVTLIFRRRYAAAGVVLSLGVLAHATIPLFAAVFATPRGVLDVFVHRTGSLPKALLGGAITVSTMVIVFVVSRGAHVEGPDPALWIEIVRLLLAHGDPVVKKLFTTSSQLEFTPLVQISLLGLAALHAIPMASRLRRGVLLGFAAVTLVTIIGVVLTSLVPVPFAIRLSLPRASGYMTFFSASAIAAWAVHTVASRKPIATVLAAVTLGSMIVNNPGTPFVPCAIGIWLTMRGMPARRRAWLLALLPAAIPAALVMFAWAVSGIGWDAPQRFVGTLAESFSALRYNDPIGGGDLWFFGDRGRDSTARLATAGGAAGLAIVWLVLARARALKPGVLVLLLGLTAAVGYSRYAREALWMNARSWHTRDGKAVINREAAGPYLEAQLWARDHTPADALFMVDPSNPSYSWRGFSRRPCFGTYREWVLFPIFYFVLPEWEDGFERVRLFGGDIDEAAEHYKSNNLANSRGEAVLRNAIREQWRTMPADDLIAICTRYGVDYIVRTVDEPLDKDRFGEPVFANSLFEIYGVPDRSEKGLEP